MADKSFINDIEGIRIQNTPLQDDILSQGPEIKRQKVLLFIGAGASIPAGLYSVIGSVDQFKKWLQSEGKTDYLEITQKIITTLQKWKNDRGEKNEIDIELLLETIEKIENRDNEVLPLFYEKSTFNLSVE